MSSTDDRFMKCLEHAAYLIDHRYVENTDVFKLAEKLMKKQDEEKESNLTLASV